MCFQGLRIRLPGLTSKPLLVRETEVYAETETIELPVVREMGEAREGAGRGGSVSERRVVGKGRGKMGI